MGHTGVTNSTSRSVRSEMHGIIKQQDCFLQKEARVCVSNAFVLEDSMYK